MTGPRRAVPRGALAVLVVGVLAGCGGRSETDTAEQFITAFNEGSLPGQYGLFDQRLSAVQLRTLTELGKECSIDPGSSAVVETGITPHLKTFGAVADCGGRDYAVVAGVGRDCGAGPGCEGDYRISPVGLPGGPESGSIGTTALPEEIRQLDPWAPAPE